MADRTSAELFCFFFEILAEDPNEANKKIAARVFTKTQSYDFMDYQMGAEKELELLGLARKRVNKVYPEDGEVWHYGPEGNDHS